jgi:8-amino-7-oxononanoate synthase
MLVMDEAHAVGILGSGGRGTTALFDVSLAASSVLTGTFSKALGGACRGYVVGPRDLIEEISQQARFAVFFLYDAIGGDRGLAALRIVRDEPKYRERLWYNTHRFREGKTPDRRRYSTHY